MQPQAITFVVRLHLGILRPEFKLVAVFPIVILSWFLCLLHGSVSMLVEEACEQVCLSCWLMARDTERGQGSFPRNGEEHCSLSVPNVLLSQFIVQHKSHILLIIPNKLK